MKRRDFLTGAAALPLALKATRAFAAYPDHNVTIVVPFPPGGQADLAARPVALKLQEIFGKPVIVDNRGGAGGAIGNAAVARADPYGSSGSYGTLHVSMEMFTANADIKLAHIPYRGAAPALTDLLSGEIKALASAPGVLKQHVDAGAIRVLANFGAQRIASFPQAATFQELGYKDVEFYIWAGLFAPAKTPEPIV